MLWVDKHRPVGLENLSYHENLTNQLQTLCSTDNFPHLLVYGPPGAGKKTRILGILREIYGPGVEKIKLDQRVFQTPSGRKLELTVTSSNYHIELTPSDVGIYDRVVVQDLIKEIAQTQQIDVNSKRSFKVVVFNEAHGLSKDAQHALRRTMEKYMGNLRIILCSNSTSKILAPIKSRCLLVRVEAPSIEQIVQVVQEVGLNEGVKISGELAAKIARLSRGNLRRALLMFEAAKVQQYPFVEDQDIVSSDWELYIEQLATSIFKEQTPSRLQTVRSSFYELLSHCIPADVILKTLAECLVKKVELEVKPLVVQFAAEYDHRLRQGQKSIFHLEAFVAKFMSTYKSFQNSRGSF